MASSEFFRKHADELKVGLVGAAADTLRDATGCDWQSEATQSR